MTTERVVGRAELRKLEPAQHRVLLPGVFFVGSDEPNRADHLRAALLWAGEGAAICGPSAAALLGLSGFEGDAVHLAVPGSPKVPPKAAFDLRLSRERELGFWDIEERDGLTVTRAERTLFDLAGTLHPARLERVVDQALRKRLTQPGRIKHCFNRLETQGRKGVAVMRALFERRGYSLQHLRSGTEDSFARVFKEQGLPEPKHDFRVSRRGKQTYFIDFAYPDQKLGIEVDTYDYHGDEVAWANDQVRLNDLVSWGWSIMRVTNYDLDRPGHVAAWIRDALAVRTETPITETSKP